MESLNTKTLATGMKLLRSLIEDHTSFGPNQWFRVMANSLQVFKHISGRPGTFPSFRPMTINQYDEIHWLHGGLFAIQQDRVWSIHMHDPSKETEGESYMSTNSKRARGLKAAMQDGKIEEIAKDDANIPQSYR